MWLIVGLGLLALFGLPLWVAIRRSTELFKLKIHEGKVELIRGRIPHALFDDLEDVFKTTTLNGELVVEAEGGRPRVRCKGFGGAVAQRSRNVVGRFQAAEIRAGRRGKNRASRRGRA